MRVYQKITIIVLIAFLFISIPSPKAEAMEPISISLLVAALAPIVLPYVIKAMPYVWKGMVNMSSAMLDVGIEMARMGYLMLGFFECTIGIPFGLFPAGVRNLVDGSIAPFKAMMLMFLVPIKTVGMI
jgi:hypothetical protein